MMASPPARCDYVVVGTGAMGMAFVDTLLTDSPDATVVMLDRHAEPGGHWVDSYEFVKLHQPATFYGVASEILEEPNDQTELASGPKIRAYYQRVLRKFIATGRVRHFGMVEYLGEEQQQAEGGLSLCRFAPKLAPDAVQTVAASKVVDATYMQVEVPSIRPPRYSVATGVQLQPLNALYHLQRAEDMPECFVVVVRTPFEPFFNTKSDQFTKTGLGQT